MFDNEEDQEWLAQLGYRSSSDNSGTRAMRKATKTSLGATSHKATRADLIREGRMIEDPKELLLAVVRGGDDARQITSRQIDAAKAVLPYVAPRLTSTEVRVKQPFGDWSIEQLERAAAHLESVGTREVPARDGNAEAEGKPAE